MKMTLLDMTQNILSRMSSDEVNSISDTTESLQVANIIKNKYFDIINRVPLPEHEQLVQLNPSLDILAPVVMHIPDGVANLKWLQYFNSDLSGGTPAPGYLYVNILPQDQFIGIVSGFNTEESNVESFVFEDDIAGFPSDYTFYYKNDAQPSYCTIINNYYVIFDSYDNTVDSTLQANKTMAYGRIIPSFTMTDTFTPNLAEEQFQLLLNEATALAFYELKQQPHELAMQEARRGWSNVQKNKAVVNRPTYFNELPNFGRRSGTSYGTRGFGQLNGNNPWQ